MKRRDEEYQIQCALIKYIKIAYPDALYTASVGGVRMSINQAKRMKATGYIAGTPDLCIYEPRGEYHGLFIELKTKDGRPSAAQLDYITRLQLRGYRAEVIRGFANAKELIDEYLM